MSNRNSATSGRAAFMCAMIVLAGHGLAGAQSYYQPGDAFELRWTQESESQTGEVSTGSSRSGNLLVETIIEVREDGLVLEYDVSPEADEQYRVREWQFPVRVFRSGSGDYEILNREEMDVRLQAWLDLGGVPREACGQWLFTWTAVQIDCDPDSVIEKLEPFDLHYGDLDARADLTMKGAAGPAVLATTEYTWSGNTYSANFKLDPETVRNDLAEADLIMAQIMGEEVPSKEAALAAHADDKISGTIEVTLKTDPAGQVISRRRIWQSTMVKADGMTETRKSTEFVERVRPE